MKITRKKRRSGYVEPTVRLVELETAVPLLANSVDEMQGTTDPTNPPGSGIQLEDFQDGGTIPIP